MRHLSILSLAVTVLIVTACASDPSPTPSSGSGTVEVASGRERIGWDQQADDAAQVAGFRYAVYVDDRRTGLSDVICEVVAGPQGFPCTARLPDLSAGTHVLELVTITPAAESPRSLPLTVTINAPVSGTLPAEWPAGIETPDGIALRVEKLSDGLDDPVDAAFVPDGRLFIAERGGRVRVLVDAQLQARDAFSSASQDDPSGDRLLTIAADPDFERTHWIYMVHATRTGAGDVFMLARYREVGGTLGERAVLIQVAAPPIPDAAAVLRVGPDRKLYLAAGAAEFPGTLLRLNLDGTLPRDQSGTTPALAQGLQAPRGLSVDPRTGIVWIADEQAGDGHLSAVGIEGRPLRAVVRARYPTAAGSGPTLFYAGDMPGFENTLLLASDAGRRLDRIHLSAQQPDRIASTETLLQDAVDPIQVLVQGPDRAIYFCTRQSLGRITPASP